MTTEFRRKRLCDYLETLEPLVMVIDLKHADSQAHSKRVARYSVLLAKEIGLGDKNLRDIHSGALIHDIGMIRIPTCILSKPGKLADIERKQIEQHPIYGYKMVEDVEFLGRAKSIILHHHERYDGTGYPNGILKDKIPVEARLFAVVDAYDAITSDRPYRKGGSYEVAREEIIKGSRKQFDPEIVKAFIKVPKDRWKKLGAEAESEIASKVTTNIDTIPLWRSSIQAKLAGIGLITTTIVHELGNSLSIINSTLQYMRDNLMNEENPQLIEAIEIGMDNLRQMSGILRNLSEFTKFQRPRFESIDLRYLLSQMLGFIHKEAEKYKIKIYPQFDDNLPNCEIESREIRQLFLNLLKNAIEAMPNGGELHVKMNLLEDKNFVRIDITDTGVGISSDDSRSIFRPFFSTKANGTGLGLAFCRHVVEEHGGKIKVKSNLNKGSTFSVVLPVRQKEGNEADEADEADE